MKRTLILYEGKAAAAEEAARAAACILSMARYLPLEELPEDLKAYEQVGVILETSPTTAGRGEEDALKGTDAFEETEASVEPKAICGSLSGRRPEVIFMNTRSESPIEAGERLAERLAAEEAQGDSLPETTVRQEAERFLKAHNTCALATGSGDSVRCTPIEYFYLDGKLYLFSEGGRKFRGLLRNPHVSVAVFDPFEGWGSLGGVQLDGTAELVPLWSEKYCSILRARGLDAQRLKAGPINMNLIEIVPGRLDMMWAGFRKLGGGLKQSCQFHGAGPINSPASGAAPSGK